MTLICQKIFEISTQLLFVTGEHHLIRSRARTKSSRFDPSWCEEWRLGGATKLSFGTFLDALFGENLWEFHCRDNKHPVSSLAYQLPVGAVPCCYSPKWGKDDQWVAKGLASKYDSGMRHVSVRCSWITGWSHWNPNQDESDLHFPSARLQLSTLVGLLDWTSLKMDRYMQCSSLLAEWLK